MAHTYEIISITGRTVKVANGTRGPGAPGDSQTVNVCDQNNRVGKYEQVYRIVGSERFVTVTGRGYKPGVTALGGMRFVLFGGCVLIFLVGIAIPLGAVALRALLPVRTTGLDFAALSLANFAQVLTQKTSCSDCATPFTSAWVSRPFAPRLASH